jgi:hypothetical protein
MRIHILINIECSFLSYNLFEGLFTHDILRYDKDRNHILEKQTLRLVEYKFVHLAY